MADRLTRIAIVNPDRCKPNKCGQQCKRNCPVVSTGKLCIEVKSTSKLAYISEELCTGCGICVKKCPFDAIRIINLPKGLDKDTTHRYGSNSFKLHRLPVPKPGQVLGLVGTNGIGKSTALKILSGRLKPNLGRYENCPDWQEIITYFRGSELQNYFKLLLEDKLKVVMKPQHVDHIPKATQGKVGEILSRKNERGMMDQLCADLELGEVLDRNVQDLSGGELQRFAIAAVALQDANVYMFDEPSSYLDVKQRLKAAQVIRSLLGPKNYVLVVEHDLSVLDYLSDYTCCLYGKQGAYGVVTLPSSVREGINIFLAGFIPTENLRFRDESLTFKVAEAPQETLDEIQTYHRYHYPTMSKILGNFKLSVQAGDFTDSQIVVMLGENGTGKTTFIKLLAGLLKPDAVEGTEVEIPEFNISYKPQKVSPKFESTVRDLLHKKIQGAYMHPQFVSDVMKPLQIEQLMDQQVQNLSGGELQRVALCICLGKPADIYLIDEPSAYLDSEHRIIAAKVIKRFILHAKKTAFVVEHDFIMATYLADKVIVYEGKPSVDCTANSPQSLVSGMNLFLSHLDITFRRDPTNYRPRINKLDSVKDRQQKVAGTHYYIED
ncbi:ABC transporter E family member 2 [Rhynchospora pubera]|uniref:ABC transporter E family member 2 n=1 Tax=Rhynchospora pubera TaxID=906938 RepID=A0AAV8G4N9_9POAL|nr:ABC transporter E family member 2 [Rhynchospora pubera]